MTVTVTFIRFVLRMKEPGGVGVPCPVRRAEVDVEPDTDAFGRAHIPGTSLAGALRSRVALAYDDATADTWFGHLLTAGAGAATGTVDAVASPVWVLGSQLVDENGRERDTDADLRRQRWSTAVNRRRGAARPYTLRGAELLAAGTRFEVFLRWDDAAPADRDRLLAALAGWRPVIGRGTSRGLGRCEAESLRHGTIRLDEPEGLRRWLTLNGPDLARDVAAERADLTGTAAVPDPTGEVISVPVRIVGPLHVGGGAAQERVDPRDGRTVQALHTEDGKTVISGAGLKGVLRSRTEFILRSVGLHALTCESTADAATPCGACWTCEVFGHGGGHDTSTGSVGRRAGIRVGDSEIADGHTRTRPHVAIDRFTGGAADKLLYTVDAVESGHFTLRIEVRPGLRDPDLFRALVRLVLADLDDGLVGLGRATTRGYGSVRPDPAAAVAAGGLPTLAAAKATLAARRAAHPEPTPAAAEEVPA
jgi:CRISPR/Cas system CSM-associated protein Csm3 (group 7 of RAMP superfamily)